MDQEQKQVAGQNKVEAAEQKVAQAHAALQQVDSALVRADAALLAVEHLQAGTRRVFSKSRAVLVGLAVLVVAVVVWRGRRSRDS
jgi:hypothetical protein